MTKQIIEMSLILRGDPTGSAESSKVLYCVNDTVETELKKNTSITSDSVLTWAEAIQAVKDEESIS